MGIYIKDMEMPRNCRECPADMMFCYWCGLLGEGADTTCFDNERRADCPLVSVPPHGRLGDLDALKAKAIERSEKCGDLVNVLDKVITAYDIKTAPTVIPAEEA